MEELGIERGWDLNLRDKSAVEEKEKETKVLLTVLATTNSALPVSVMLDRCFAALGDLTGAKSYAIWLLNEMRPQLSLAFAAPVDERAVLLGSYWQALASASPSQALQEVAQLGITMAIANASEDARLTPELRALFGRASLLVLPLLVKERVLGVAVLAGPKGARLLDDEILPICQAAMAAITSAIDNARLMERERCARQAKDEFISVVSHELKTPLTSISGYAQLLTRHLPEETNDVLRGYLTVIVEKTREVTQLINDMLNLPHGNLLASGPIREEVDLAAVIRKSVGTVQTLSARHQVVAESPERLVVQGDPERLRQVVEHLLVNAVKYSPMGGTITVRLAEEQRPDSKTASLHALLSISDPGIGISPLHLPYIFERFYGTDTSDGRHYGGLGLGLSVCRQIIEEHGGRIWVESQPGVGSTFYFSIPIAK